MEFCKLQIGCLIIALYIGMIYMRERRIYNIKKRDKLFDLLIIAGIFEIIVDGSTAYTVNHIDKIPGEVNLILHMFFFNRSRSSGLSDVYIYVETYEQSSGKRKTGRKILDGSYIAVNYKRNHSRIVY